MRTTRNVAIGVAKTEEGNKTMIDKLFMWGLRLVIFSIFAKAALWVLVFILALLDGK